MGIPSYFSYIVRQHRKIIRPFTKKTEKIDNLYLDCNSIIYDAVHNDEGIKDVKTNVMNEEKLIYAVCEKIAAYIRLIEPTQRVFIAFDGIAPIAKMNQQRNRRYMSLLLDDQNQAQKTTTGEEKKKKAWNTSAITPGTEFMHQLNEQINRFFSNKAKEYGLEEIIISTAAEAGEGEHKIYEYIRENAEYHKGTKTVIYGLDADLIMLTLTHLHISNELYLFRETPHFIQHIDKTLNPNDYYLMDINVLGDIISADLSGINADLSGINADLSGINADLSAEEFEQNTDDGITTMTKKVFKRNNNKIFDYIFMCFFLGNDFMPHFPALNIRTNGINYLLNAYKFVFAQNGSMAAAITDKNGTVILWKNVRKWIDHLSKNEINYLQGEYKKRDKQNKIAKRFNEKAEAAAAAAGAEAEEYLTLPLRERSIEKYINPFEQGWEARYYKTLLDVKINAIQRQKIAGNYLQGLEWTMKYYTTGCIDWRWKYNYSYPPLLTDLLPFVPYFDTCLLPPQTKNPVLSLVQLCYVLPERSLHLLPPNLKGNLLKNHKAWYTTDCDLKWSFCKYLWEAHASLPAIDISALEKIVEAYLQKKG
jgi:5'-3' exonuclease